MITRTFPVACVGGQHHQHEEALNAGWLKPGAEVKFVPDPTNLFDSNAIQVHLPNPEGGEVTLFIGFVARAQAFTMTNARKRGCQHEARVTLVRKNSCMLRVTETLPGGNDAQAA